MKRILGLLMAFMLCLVAFTLIGGVNTVKAAEDDIASGTSGTCSWVIDKDGVLTIRPTDGVSGQLASYAETAFANSVVPWKTSRNSITKVVIEPGVSTGAGCCYLFYGMNNCSEADLRNLDTSAATNMTFMFDGCSSLTSLDLSSWDTSNVTGMIAMFQNCSSLTSLDVSGFDTSNVINMNSIFRNCSKLPNLDVSRWNTSNVTNMSDVFEGCSLLTSLDVSRWNTSNVTNMRSMFSGCSKITALNVSNFDTSHVTDMGYMFYQCSALLDLDLTNFNTAHVTKMDWMFQSCKSLSSLNLSSFNTECVTDMSNMFKDCTNLGSLDVSSFNTSNVADMSQMFQNAGLISLNLKNFNTSKVTTMSGMFQNCKKLKTLDVSNFNTSKVTTMMAMFKDCESLKNLDLSSFNTDRVTSMIYMFNGCNELASLDISGFNTNNANMFYMFSDWGNKKLAEICLGEKHVFKDSYSKLPTPPSTSPYTGKWIREDGVYGPYTPDELRTNYTSEMVGKWIWYTPPKEYRLSFFEGENGTGAMQSVNAVTNKDFTLPANQFMAFGYDFDHWDDGNGKTYADKGTISANTYAADQKVTLTAVWKKRDTSLNWDGNEAEFSIRAGEQAVLDNIPAGTSYQVYELTPDGWILVQQENASGVIEALEESAAAFWNKYQPGVTTVQFSGLKNLDGRPAEAGKFTFELYEGETLVDTATTQDGGFIQFKVIEYDAAGDHVYTIREVDPNDDTIDYDTHEETVEVSVTDNGDGTLSSEVKYDDDGIVFSNTTRPGTLRITKNATNGTIQNVNDEFTIEIEFRNESGMPINDNIYWYVEGGATTPSEISGGNQE